MSELSVTVFPTGDWRRVCEDDHAPLFKWVYNRGEACYSWHLNDTARHAPYYYDPKDIGKNDYGLFIHFDDVCNYRNVAKWARIFQHCPKWMRTFGTIGKSGFVINLVFKGGEQDGRWTDDPLDDPYDYPADWDSDGVAYDI